MSTVETVPGGEDERDEQIRAQFARQLATLLDQAVHYEAAQIVRSERTDGGWP